VNGSSSGARDEAEFGRQPVATASRSSAGIGHPDYLVLLYAWRTARQPCGAAELAACGGRTVVHPVRTPRSSAGARTGPSRRFLPALQARSDTCVSGSIFFLIYRTRDRPALADARGTTPQSNIDNNRPLLIVIHFGHHRKAQGRGVRQEALLGWNGVMSQQCMAYLGRPLYYPCCLFKSGLTNRPPTALPHGATVTIHPRFHRMQRSPPLPRERTTLTVLVPRDHSGGDRSSRLAPTPTFLLRQSRPARTIVQQH